MYCPVCREVALVMADRQGIEVDYCPQCRGVWLDRGELDKIIERVALTQGGATPQTPQPRDRSPSEYRQYRDHDDDYRRKKKRRGLLDELFDFD
jgi:Zn-finger nucleic acid-binding protein